MPGESVDRRQVLRWMAAAAAAPAFPVGASPPGEPAALAEGYGVDPPLNQTHAPGAFWPLTLDQAQLRTLTALCDALLPEDDRSPAASALGVPAYLDEWLSAPYPVQQADRAQVLPFLGWLDREAQRRAGQGFADLTEAERETCCAALCARAGSELEDAARAFARVRVLAMGAFYATPEGMRDLGYVGNVGSGSFDGPPPEVLERLGL